MRSQWTVIKPSALSHKATTDRTIGVVIIKLLAVLDTKASHASSQVCQLNMNYEEINKLEWGILQCLPGFIITRRNPWECWMGFLIVRKLTPNKSFAYLFIKVLYFISLSWAREYIFCCLFFILKLSYSVHLIFFATGFIQWSTPSSKTSTCGSNPPVIWVLIIHDDVLM